MAPRPREATVLDWEFLGQFPELFGAAVRSDPPEPPEPSQIPKSVAWEAADWMGDVLGKLRKILSSEHENALFVQRRLDAWAESARELGIRLGLYSRRLEDLEVDNRKVDRRLLLATAWQEELQRQALTVEAAERGVKEAAEGAAKRRELLRELIELQTKANAADEKARKRQKKKKALLGAIKSLKPKSLKPSGKPKLRFKPLA